MIGFTAESLLWINSCSKGLTATREEGVASLVDCVQVVLAARVSSYRGAMRGRACCYLSVEFGFWSI